MCLNLIKILQGRAKEKSPCLKIPASVLPGNLASSQFRKVQAQFSELGANSFAQPCMVSHLYIKGFLSASSLPSHQTLKSIEKERALPLQCLSDIVTTSGPGQKIVTGR